MAKIAYSKLGLNKMANKEAAIIHFNDLDIEVSQYLPIEKKLDLIEIIINKSIDNNEYFNPCRIDIFLTLEIVFAYTNITFTEKQKEDILKLYDLFIETGIFKTILENIPYEEYIYIKSNVIRTIQNVYKYKNSALGIFESITSDYSQLDLDATNIQQKLADPDNMKLLRNVLTKLG